MNNVKKLFIFMLFCSLSNCSSKDSKKVEKKDEVVEKKIEIKVVKKVKKVKKETVKISVKTGWSDKDTYVVQVVSGDEHSAVGLAKTKILKDIIKVRLKKYGTYTKIQEIKEEFEKPLKNGKIINREKVKNGIKIFYQIRDNNLKQKFELKK